jgi:3,4-dihydroxy 2-butanone 4-phosphate synthase/GTP cyclohydrolase II
MARLPELVGFAQLHGLKIGAIADLIAYRRLHDHMIDKVLERDFESRYGAGFKLHVFRNNLDGAEYPALVRGEVRPDRPVLVRMHRADIGHDLLGEAGPRASLLHRALTEIGAEEGGGVIVLLRDRHPNWMATNLGAPSDDPEPDLRHRMLREYGVGAQILRELGVRRMVLLSDSPQLLVGLEGYGLTIVGWRSFKAEP